MVSGVTRGSTGKGARGSRSARLVWPLPLTTKVLEPTAAWTADVREGGEGCVSVCVRGKRGSPPSRSPRAPFGFSKWTMLPSSLKRLTSSMPGMVVTPRRFRVCCRRLSSVDAVLCVAFFLRRIEPLPPVRVCVRAARAEQRQRRVCEEAGRTKVFLAGPRCPCRRRGRVSAPKSRPGARRTLLKRAFRRSRASMMDWSSISCTPAATPPRQPAAHLLAAAPGADALEGPAAAGTRGSHLLEAGGTGGATRE